MKKLFVIFAFLFMLPANAISIGTYKTETEYGLIDGFKFNFFGRKDGEKMIQLKSETPEEKARLERQKDKPKEVQDEHQLFKFMQEGTVAF